jgi:hypothetical protein
MTKLHAVAVLLLAAGAGMGACSSSDTSTTSKPAVGGAAGASGEAGAAGEDAGDEGGEGEEAGDDAAWGEEATVPWSDAACNPPHCAGCCAEGEPDGAAELQALASACACGGSGKCMTECDATLCASSPLPLEGTCAVCVKANCMADMVGGCTTAGCQTVWSCLDECM